MARIQDFDSQVSAQGPVGGLDPRVEAASSIGRAVQRFGQTVEQTGDFLAKRQEQAETADIYSFIADQRDLQNQKIQQGMQDGNIDIDKIKSDFQDAINDYADQNVQTAGGQNYLQRQASRLLGTTTQKAALAKSHIDGIQAAQQLQSGMNSDSNSLMQDPTQFQDIVDAQSEHIDQMVKTGTITPMQAEKFSQSFNQEYAKAAIRGYANLNPDFAKQKLDDGTFDDYFDSDVKKQMYGEVKQASYVKELDAKRAQKALDDEQAAKVDAIKSDWLPKIMDGSLPAATVYSNQDLGFADKKEVLNMLSAAQRKEFSPNPAVLNQLRADIYSGKITDIAQVTPQLSSGDISPLDMKALSKLIPTTPDAKAMNQNRKALFDVAKAELVKKDQFGLSDPQGQQNLLRFQEDLQVAEANMRADGKSPKDLYNINSPDYFGKNIASYKRTAQQILSDQANQVRGVMPPIQPVNAQGAPIGSVPQAQPVSLNPRKPGESAQAYLARIKAAK